MKTTDLQDGLLKQGILLIDGEVNHGMLKDVAQQLIRLTALGSPKLTVIISSSGGDVDAGLHIYDLIRNYSGHTEGVVITTARSMGAVILQACKRRKAFKHAKILIHHISRRSVSLDEVVSVRRRKVLVDDLRESQKHLNQILTTRTGRTHSEIRRQCQLNTDMLAEQALEFGLIDEIAEPEEPKE